MITSTQKKIILRILSPYNPREIGIFGSYSRGNIHPESDLDIWVSFGSKINLFDLVGIEQELSEQLGIKVDLVTRNSLSPMLRPIIEKDLLLIA